MSLRIYLDMVNSLSGIHESALHNVEQCFSTFFDSQNPSLRHSLATTI